ncbi:hypothetical protein [Echinicola vietnamensis]|uniref:hypothetical protein n=1 Tax=Echinicola vietnamensis TaxID=390884 RepID=UPI0012F9B723|nr:hypothetical protein [Echinicola vietnamensis]
MITKDEQQLLEATTFIVSISRGWSGLEIPKSMDGVNDFEDVVSMLGSGSEDPLYGEGKYGAIIGYELRHIDTNELAEVTFSAEYEVPKVVISMRLFLS